MPADTFGGAMYFFFFVSGLTKFVVGISRLLLVSSMVILGDGTGSGTGGGFRFCEVCLVPAILVDSLLLCRLVLC